MVEPNYPIWSIWTQLAFVHRLFWLLLTLVGAYVLFSAAVIWARLRSRIAHAKGENNSSSRRSLADLEGRLRNMRQLIGAVLFLFWLLFFIQLPHDIWVTESGRLSLGMAILGTVSLDFAFGANVFFVLLVLHSAQWFVSAQVSAARQHLDI
jgi:hypothetical protein